jgi:hypothetical protein
MTASEVASGLETAAGRVSRCLAVRVEWWDQRGGAETCWCAGDEGEWPYVGHHCAIP